jgi:hypothetical protein
VQNCSAAGATVLGGGALTPASGGSVLIQGGSLGGGGFVNAVVTNFGSIILGPAPSALALSSNLVLTGGSMLNVQLGGYTRALEYGYASAGKGVNLAGNIFVTLVNGFVPVRGSSFTVLSSDQPITGGFGNATHGFRIQTMDGAGSFVYVQNQKSIVLDFFLPGPISSLPYLAWALSYYGCTNCTQSSELADPDGDGANNRNEFYGGTDPTNRASSVRITSVARRTNDMVISWRTVGGRTNVLQVANGDASGSLTDNFVNILPLIAVTGIGETTTNQVDVGGATNAPARFYRVRLVPW